MWKANKHFQQPETPTHKTHWYIKNIFCKVECLIVSFFSVKYESFSHQSDEVIEVCFLLHKW